MRAPRALVTRRWRATVASGLVLRAESAALGPARVGVAPFLTELARVGTFRGEHAARAILTIRTAVRVRPTPAIDTKLAAHTRYTSRRATEAVVEAVGLGALRPVGTFRADGAARTGG